MEGNPKKNLWSRGAAGMLAGILFSMAYMAFNDNYHEVCTQVEQSYDGQECVGEYKTVEGRDWSGALLWTLLGLVAGYYSVRENDN